jgi:hypothetical protein
MAKPKPTYLGRDLATSPVHYALILSEDEFHAELRRLRVPPHQWGSWASSEGNFGYGSARCHHLHCHGENLALVCIAVPEDGSTSGVQIASLLVHEAVHIWQRICEIIGEVTPSSEFEAYSIQHISQELMNSYAEQTGQS